ncbi:Protein of unknown function (DUF1638) [Hoeflea phototrophica DFL-43]|uniref:DUF1638 domain-containing protein n=1 Tax=Hoeflea phototrophica (strain DSM 17068 / NCIMB 14078 / DFL-43) TaxID=411684 RepID=A9DBY6_HOEPD|nr:DUF1638 domain-containing protein [Hoeflea phototrophica]EDQ32320.2 Protein of unknown function (DUF1638) [Hoeflea phototrophica DFL-43]
MKQQAPKRARSSRRVRVIACGMIAREVLAVNAQLGQDHIDLKCVDANFHHHPERIAPAVERAILQARQEGFDNIFIGYADCGTGGALDRVCKDHGVERIEGPHCFSFYVGNEAFKAEGDAMMTTFFITDFLARHFEAFLIRPLGLDRFPELRDTYFGHYERALYLAQTDDPELEHKARDAANRLGLPYERRLTGYGDLAIALSEL